MKKAFTMIELVFVIVVIGILAAAIIPSTKTNPLQEAAIQLISHIRYTQHLSIVNDNYDNTDGNWTKGRTQIVFSSVGSTTSQYSDNLPAYTIFADRDLGSGYGGDATLAEIAKNPSNPSQYMSGGYGSGKLDIRSATFAGMKKMNLGKSYGVTSIKRSGGCKDMYHLMFDEFGRPMTGTHTPTKNSHALIIKDCNITLSDGSESVVITIRPETGYASINF